MGLAIGKLNGLASSLRFLVNCGDGKLIHWGTSQPITPVWKIAKFWLNFTEYW